MKADVSRAIAAVAELLRAEPQWRGLFKRSCEAGTLGLQAATPRFRDELAERGKRFASDEVEDALLLGARHALPGTPAARWSPEWAEGLCRDALAHLQERYEGLSLEERDALDLSAKAEWEARMVRAGRSNDPPAFRAALRGWQRLVLEALKTAQDATRNGAA